MSSPRPSGRGRPIAIASVVALTVLSLAIAAGTVNAVDPRPGAREFDIPGWEARNFLNKWLYAAGGLFRAERPAAEQDADLRRFFAAVHDVGAYEREAGDGARERLAGAVRERGRLENRAEATLEARISAIAGDQGLTRGLWVLPDMVWPPVDLEFTTPPRTLAISPRERIELKETSLLRAGLDLGEVEGIEHDLEAEGGVSAITFPTAGVGAYPTVITYTDDYRDAVEVAAHEWTHNYLSFRALGVRYYASNDLRTMNETVADLVGREIADGVLARWPLITPAPAAARADRRLSARPSVDLRAELVKLRGEVDALLAAGKVDEAEALMEERRRFLADNGQYIRRINQAYFAFTNLYAGAAGSPGAVNPIGPKIDELRRRSPSLAVFLRVAGDLTSVADLDRALAQR